MRIGIVSDTHGRERRLQRALQHLQDRHVDCIVHCGDVGSAGCLELLAGSGVPVHVVAGNTDRAPQQLVAAARQLGLEAQPGVLELEVDPGQMLAVTHGHDAGLLRGLLESGRFAWVCHGHTHRARNEQIGPVHVINPGALHWPRDPRHPTVALLDTSTDAVELLTVR